MWILLVLSLTRSGYDGSFSSSQIAVEFNTKEACVAAATEWSKRTYTNGERKITVLCTPKG